MTQLDRVRSLTINTFPDDRGSLTALEGAIEAPFKIRRVFFVHHVLPPFERGGHAHRATEQVLSCVSGSMKIDLADGAATQTYVLDHPSVGLYVPELIWTRLYDFTPDAVMFSAASTHYQPDEVIRDWQQFLDEVRADG